MGIISLTTGNCPLFTHIHHAHEQLQAEKHVSDNGEESVHHPTAVGRIFKIAVTKTRREYVIMHIFRILESRDHRYGMPIMHENPDEKYQVIPPSVSCNYLLA